MKILITCLVVLFFGIWALVSMIADKGNDPGEAKETSKPESGKKTLNYIMGIPMMLWFLICQIPYLFTMIRHATRLDDAMSGRRET